MRRLIPLFAAVAVAGTAAVAVAQQESGLTLSPSSAEGIARPNVLVGPFGLRNTSRVPFDVQLAPVLLAQRRDGGLTVGDSDASRRAAQRALRLNEGSFELPRGATRQFRARVELVPARGSLYAGVLFAAVPQEEEAEGIGNALELVATMYLHPPESERRIRFATEPIRAEQGGPRRLRFLVGVKNTGNYYTTVNGRLRLLDQNGKRVFAGRLRGLKILPGAVVDLPLETTPKELIPAGLYQAEADLESEGRRFEASGTIRLYGPSQVATRNAKLLDPSPEAYRGEPFELEVPYRNTGNVSFQPEAHVLITPQPTGRGIEVTPQVSETEPRERGSITSTVELPDDVETFLVRVQLKLEDRVLDERTFSVTRVEKPSWFDRFRDWLAENVLLVILVLLALVAAAGIAGLRYVRRLRARADKGAAAVEQASPATVGTVVEEQSPAELLDLNAATADELATLPGIGPRAAARIIDRREEYGPLASLEELSQLEGFDAERVEALRRHVRV